MIVLGESIDCSVLGAWLLMHAGIPPRDALPGEENRYAVTEVRVDVFGFEVDEAGVTHRVLGFPGRIPDPTLDYPEPADGSALPQGYYNFWLDGIGAFNRGVSLVAGLERLAGREDRVLMAWERGWRAANLATVAWTPTPKTPGKPG